MWGIELERNSTVSLSRQIYQELRNQIIKGRMKPDEALPSTRALASQLAVSRNTICEAYDMLLAEAFVVSRQGSPTRVAQGVQLDHKNPLKRSAIQGEKPKYCCKVSFRTGQPDVHSFPVHQWLQLMHKASEALQPEHWGYTDPEGFPSLREELASWLLRSRGMVVNPQDVFITAGATHALHILAELLYEDSGEILVEDPCHTGMLRTLKNRGFTVVSIPVDEHGMKTEYLRGNKTKAVYVTPSHQFPLGGILPASRRTSLIQYATEKEAYIIEDDYDSEFRYCGPPIAPLYTMDPGRVIYVGTFSKILFPALRIGYVVVPHELQIRWRYLRMHTDVQNPPFEQATLAEFLRSRRLDRHVQQMRKLYGHRRNILMNALEEKFGKEQLCWGDAAGLHLAVEFSGACFDNHFLQRCKETGIYLSTVDYHSIQKGRHLDKLLLGYGHLKDDDILAGISLLHQCIVNVPPKTF